MTTLHNTYSDIADVIEHLLEDANTLTPAKIAELKQVHAEITRLDQGGTPTPYSQEALAAGLRYDRYQTADGEPYSIPATAEEHAEAQEYLCRLAFSSTICAADARVDILLKNLVSGVLPRTPFELRLLLALRKIHDQLGTNLDTPTGSNLIN